MDQSKASRAEKMAWAKELPAEHILTTFEASDFMGAFGVRIAVNTLTTWRSRRSTGPVSVKYGRKVGYRVDDLRTYLSRLIERAA